MTLRLFIKRAVALAVLFFAVDFVISEILLHGLYKYHGFDNNPDILINGTSGTLSAFNKTEIEQGTQNAVALFAREGVSVDDRYAMVEYFYSEYPRSVKTVVYEIDPKLFSTLPAAANIHTQFFPYMDNEIIDLYIRKHAGATEYLISKYIRCRRYDLHFLKMAARGYLGYSENAKTGILDTIPLLANSGQEEKIEVEMNEEKMCYFEKTMDLIRGHGAKVMLVLIPIHYLKNQTFDTSSMKRFYRYFEEYQRTHANVEFIDLNHGHVAADASLFRDPVHLNGRGQKAVSRSMIQILKKR